jgi:type IV fimbrial biogenesis protein FimT
MSRRYSKGFTLVELMVVIAIAAILLAVALPSFQGSLRSNRVATTGNEMLASLSLARSEAIRSTRGGGVCPSADGATCAVNWNSGWLVWTEVNGNGALDAGDTVVRYSQAKPRLTLTSAATAITFDSRGRAIGGAQRIQLSPQGATDPIRCLQVGVTGQIRIVRQAC